MTRGTIILVEFQKNVTESIKMTWIRGHCFLVINQVWQYLDTIYFSG